LTAEEKKHELSKYRIKQAEESLEEARFLLSGNKSPRSIINRVYYALFDELPILKSLNSSITPCPTDC
jgi:hypothetical protein